VLPCKLQLASDGSNMGHFIQSFLDVCVYGRPLDTARCRHAEGDK
jgi:hypothetical protein